VNAFVGLDAHRDQVGRQFFPWRQVEDRDRRALELHHNLAGLATERLAGAQVEWNAFPAPVIDKQFERRVGRRLRIGGDALSVAVTFVLGAHRVLEAHRAHGAQRLDLFIAQLVCLERVRCSHRNQRQQLQQMVLEHVAQDAGLVVVTPAPSDIDCFHDADLHAFDIGPVPDWLEHGVGEAEEEDVLRGLFAQIMVDAVNLLFVQGSMQVVVQFLGAGEIVTEGLFDDHPPPAAAVGDHASLVQVFDGCQVLSWRQRQIIEPVGRAIFLLFEEVDEIVIVVGIGQVAGDVPQQPGELIPGRIVECLRSHLLHVFAQVVAKIIMAVFRPRKADDTRWLIQPFFTVQVIQRRHQLTPRQVAGAAQNND